MELVQILMNKLGIAEGQAKGGAGLLFKLAKEKLGADEFDKITNAFPGIGELLSSAPKPDGLAGALGGLASSLGGGAGRLGNLASLAGGFKSLKLDPAMIGEFIPILLSFVESKGGTAIKGILEKVLQK